MPLGPIITFQEIASGRHIQKDKAQPWGARDTGFDPVTKAILTLSLYSDEFFGVPHVGVIEEGWRADWIKREPIRTVRYEVLERDWNKFQSFIAVAEKSLPGLTHLPRFAIAARRYLIATFSKGNDFFPRLSVDQYSWDEATGERKPESTCQLDEYTLAEDVLLHYIFVLEALVGEHTAPGSANDRTKRGMLARGTASLIGRDRREVEWISTFLTKAYVIRNGLVHEGALQREPPDLRVLRRCCQRALGVVLHLGESQTPPDVERLILQVGGGASADRSEDSLASKQINRARTELLRKVSDSARLDRWKSPTTEFLERPN